VEIFSSNLTLCLTIRQSATGEINVATELPAILGSGWRLSGLASGEARVSSQNVIGEKYLVPQLQWTVGKGLQRTESQAKKPLCPVKV
jgi:hypothetical protein